MNMENIHSGNAAIDAGSGDVFTDLGFANADERRRRLQLAMRLNQLIADCDLTQAKAAALLAISQPQVSELKHYKLGRVSSEQLTQLIALLDGDVEKGVRPKAGRRAPPRSENLSPEHLAAIRRAAPKAKGRIISSLI